MECKTCQKELTGPNFCSHCGQKVITDRFTTRKIISTLLSQITNLDRGFTHTILMLFTNPSKVAKDYIAGSTMPYYNPIRLLLILATISAIISVSSGIYDLQQEEIQAMVTPDIDVDEATTARQQAFQNEIKKYLQFVIIAILPFITMVSYRFFRKRGYNYAEHLIMNTFFFCATTIVGLVAYIVYYSFPQLLPYMSLVGILINGSYFAFAYRSLFQLSWFRSFLAGIGVFFLGFLVFMLAIAITSFIIGVLVIVIMKALS